MILAFTVCSNNYLAQAFVLSKSWLRYHPEARFIIVLVDEVSGEIVYDRDERVSILPLGKIPLENLPELIRQYNIIELNTAIKADAFIYLSSLYRPDKILYIDPDIQVYSRFDEVLDLLENHDFVVTPHFCTPVDDEHGTSDVAMLRIGLFNLGFLAVARPDQQMPFFDWWRQRLYKYCYYNEGRALFYDQIWINFIIVFFDKWHVLKHPGYNMANWNFHERELSSNGEEGYLVNGLYPLRFFHFSGFKLDRPDVIAAYHTRYTFATRPDLVNIYRAYRESCMVEGAEKLSRMPCVYWEQHKQQKAKADAIAWRQLPLKAKLRRSVGKLLRKLVG